MRVFTSTLAVLALCSVTQEGAGQSTTAVAIRFRAQVREESFACGRQYKDIGSARSTVEGTEFKFFVHDVRLVRRDGVEVPVQLTQDGLWQSEGVALLDFEDGTGACSNGNADMHTSVDGVIPSGDYTGIRFAIGVPFDRNHRDPTAAPSPLSLTRMFWAWNSGYKFMRIDMRANDKPWVIHLGSTECTPTGTATTVPTTCRWPNRATVSLDGFTPSRDAVVLDLAALLAASNVAQNQPQTAVGCMSATNDRDCAGVFAALGLAHADQPAGKQTAFRVERIQAAGAGNGSSTSR